VRCRPGLPLRESRPGLPIREKPTVVIFAPSLWIHPEQDPLLGYRVSLHLDDLEVTDARSAAPAEALSLLPDSVPSPSPPGVPAADLRGAALSAPAPCAELSGLAAPESGRDPDTLPGLRGAGPSAGRSGAHLASPGGQLPARRAPGDARRDIGAKPGTTRGYVPLNGVARGARRDRGESGSRLAELGAHNRPPPRDAIGPQAPMAPGVRGT
jgi:hypothetical protein